MTGNVASAAKTTVFYNTEKYPSVHDHAMYIDGEYIGRGLWSWIFVGVRSYRFLITWYAAILVSKHSNDSQRRFCLHTTNTSSALVIFSRPDL